MDKILIYGCGGHAKVVADVIQATSKYKVSCYFDSNPEIKDLNGIPVFNNKADLKSFIAKENITLAVVAIGNNRIRKKYHEEAIELGLNLPAITHPSAIISSSATLQSGTVVMPSVVVNASTNIGEGVILNTGAIVEHDCEIASFAHIAPGAVLCGGVTVGELTLFGARSVANPLKKIGSHCNIGSGSVVVKDIPDSACAYGTPAKVIKFGS